MLAIIPSKYRQATAAEILADKAIYLRQGWQVRYRHFVREVISGNSKNGVAHREHSRSSIYVIDGKPHVKHHGKLTEITASIVNAGGREAVFDLRIKSEYLP